MGFNLGSIFASVGLNVAPLKAGIAQSQTMMSGLDKSMATSASKTGKTMSAFGNVGVLAVAAIGVASVKLASDFDKSMREVNTLLLRGEAGFKQLKTGILDMSTTVEHSATSLANGFYEIVSALPDASDADRMALLEQSSRAATAGLADLPTVADATTTAINAWGLATEDAERVTDALLMTVQRGKTHLPELAESLDKIGTSARNVGIPMETALAAVASLTKAGLSTEKSMTYLNRAFIGFLKPSAEATEWVHQFGYESINAMMQAEGFEGVIKNLNNTVGTNAEVMATMFPNIRELQADLVLAGGSFSTFVGDMESFQKTAGITDKMFNQMAETAEVKWNVALNNAKKILIDIGGEALPPITAGIEVLSAVFKIASSDFLGFSEQVAYFGDIMSAITATLESAKEGFEGVFESLSGSAAGAGVFGEALQGLMNIANIFSGQTLVEGAKKIYGAFTQGSQAAKDYVASMHELSGQFDQQHQGAIKLAGQLADLQTAQEGLEGADLEANLKGQTDLMMKLNSIMPGFITSMDEFGNVTAYDAEMLGDLAIQSGKVSEGVGNIATQFGELHIKNAELATDMQAYTTSQQSMLEGLTAVTGDLEEARQLMSLFEQDGQAAWGVIEQAILSAGDSGKEWQGTIEEAANAIAALQEKHGGNFSKMAADLANNQVAWDSWVANMSAAMVELAAQGPAGAVSKQMQQVTAVLASSEPEMQQAGVQLMATFLQSMEGGVDPALAGQLAQTLFDTGTFTATGVGAVDSALSAMEASLRSSRLKQAGADAVAGLKSAFDTFFGDTRQEKKEISIEVTDDGSAADTTNELQEVEDKANELSRVKPTVNVKGNTAQPNAAIARLVNRAKALDGQTLATVNIKAQIIGSGPFTADQYAKYLEDTISKAQPKLTVMAGVGGVGGGGALSSMAGEVGNLTAKWNALDTAFGTFWADAEAAPYREVEESIIAITGGSWEHLRMWRELRDSYDTAAAKLDAYDTAIKSHEKNIENLTGKQQELNESLQKHQAELSRLSQMKIKGETAADQKSFDLQQKSSKLQLAILKAEKKGDYEKAAMLTLEKERVDAAKEMHDLQTDVDFAGQRREIQQMLDPLHGQEMTRKEIVKAIQNELDAIAKKEAQLVEVAAAIKKEQDAVIKLKVEFDNAKVHVDSFKDKIDEMARHFLDKMREMQQAAQEVGGAISGAGGGSYAGAGSMGGAGARAPAVSSSYGVTVNVPLYLDGHEIAYATTRVTGSNASRYARSGGRY